MVVKTPLFKRKPRAGCWSKPRHELCRVSSTNYSGNGCNGLRLAATGVEISLRLAETAGARAGDNSTVMGVMRRIACSK
jgi:hypothetical protein